MLEPLLAARLPLYPGRLFKLPVGPAEKTNRYLSPIDKSTPLKRPSASVTAVPVTVAVPVFAVRVS